jgi:hypothetical protein
VLEEHGALVFGDSWPGGPIPDDWLPKGKTRAEYDAWLVPLLEPPVELCCRRTVTRIADFLGFNVFEQPG